MIDYEKLSDADLIIHLRAGDYSAYSEIYERFFGLLYVFICRRLQDKDEAKSILERIFTDLWMQRETLEIPVLSFFLYKTVRNKMINLMVRKDVEEKFMQSVKNFMEQDPPVTDHPMRDKELAAVIEKGVDQLPESIREVFLRSRRTNPNYREILD